MNTLGLEEAAMTGLFALSVHYEAMRTEKACAEAQLLELQDLLCAFFRERDEGAGDWLRALAEVNAPDYETRRAARRLEEAA